LVLGHDVVDSGGDIAIEGATRFNRPDIHSIQPDIGNIELSEGSHRR
jgi:hypothetical protein